MNSIETLLAGLIDYAGLFLPAELDMRGALQSYAGYLQSSDSEWLGRFIVPVGRLDEMDREAPGLLSSESPAAPWRMSALVSEDVRGAMQRVLEFNRAHGHPGTGRAQIDTVELRAGSAEEIAGLAVEIPRDLTTYFEVSAQESLQSNIAAIRRAGARAKIRTGGVTASAFPTGPQLLKFLSECLRAGVAFKATAGLHHPVSSSYPYTYDPASESGPMFGFLNVFLAAALLRRGTGEATALALLEDADATSFRFDDDAITWRDHVLSVADLRFMRECFGISFGSCSFTEPVTELKRFTSQTAAV